MLALVKSSLGRKKSDVLYFFAKKDCKRLFIKIEYNYVELAWKIKYLMFFIKRVKRYLKYITDEIF